MVWQVGVWQVGVWNALTWNGCGLIDAEEGDDSGNLSAPMIALIVRGLR